MDKFDFHPATSSTLTTAIRRASLEITPSKSKSSSYPSSSTTTFSPPSILKPASSQLRRLSLTAAQSIKKTVRFTVPPLPSTSSISSNSRSVVYNLQTAYAFIKSDIKTIVVPQTMFGLIHAYAATTSTTTQHQDDAWAVLQRTPLVLTWILLNLLPFCIDNQRHPASIAEDRINKPHRPLACQRLTPSQAYTWMMMSYIAAFILSWLVGGMSMWFALLVLGWLYNDCGMSERGWVGRNVLTALGYAAFGVGALMVALPPTTTPMPTTKNTPNDGTYAGGLEAKMWTWISILALVIGTTGQMTDLVDLAGDAQKGRKTIPIIYGEAAAKWTVCVPVAVWSVLCPWFWETRFLGFVVPVMLGGKIVERLLTTTMTTTTTTTGEGEREKSKGYKTTFRLWNLWVAVLYLMPLMTR